MMNVSAKAQSTVTPPVLLCRLCHCEFTNFKEHVKSLVHLDARETKSTPKPPTKNKGCFEESTVIAKKGKTENFSEQSNLNEDIENDYTSSRGSECTPSENKTEYSTNNQLENLTISAADKSDADLSGTATLKTNNEIQGNHRPVTNNEVGSKRDELTKVVFLERHWHCKLCDCVQCVENESFDKHACDRNHQEALACEHLSSRQTVKESDFNQWLINCSACAFETNDTAQFVSHLQTELHDHNIRKVMQHAGTAISDNSLKTHSRKCTSEVSETNTKSYAKVASVDNQKNTNSKSVTHQAETSKNTSRNSYQGKDYGANGTPRVSKFNSSSTPKPLMSLSLPKRWNKNSAGCRSTSWNHSASSKPGILGEYRPDFLSKKIGFDGYCRDDPFSRSTDIRSALHHDSLLHSRIDSSSPTSRPTYSEVNRHSLAATSRRTFELDSVTSLLGSNKCNSVWPGQASLASPTEKLNAWAFGQVEQESPSRQLDLLGNFLSSQRTGVLPSTVSLDLASNSSFKVKQSSERDTMFDNYCASMSEASRTVLSRNNLSRINLSTADHYSRSMCSRR